MSKLLTTVLMTSVASLCLLTGCQVTPQKCVEDVRKDENITVGKVQRTIQVGMTNADVVNVLGSPNIVSTDEQRREVWVYDKLATETVYSQRAVGGGIGALVLGGSGGGLGGLSGSKHVGAKSTTQRTLTVVIKFSKQGTVRVLLIIFLNFKERNVKVKKITPLLGMLLPLMGCQSAPPPSVLKVPDNALKMRSLQCRGYDTRDEKKILQASASSLQDMGFALEESETKLGWWLRRKMPTPPIKHKWP